MINGLCRLKQAKAWAYVNISFKWVKALSSSRVQSNVLIFLGELIEWQYNLQIIPYEFVIEVGKSKETLDITNITCSLSFWYYLNFLRIHQYTFIWNGITRALNLFAMKTTLFQFGPCSLEHWSTYCTCISCSAYVLE
jgi:hypothetical protein